MRIWKTSLRLRELESGDLRREPVTGEVAKYIDRIFDVRTNQPLYFFCKLCNRVFVHNNSSSSNRRHLRETHGLKISRCFGDGPGNESGLQFDLNSTGMECSGEDENVCLDAPIVPDWSTQTTSGEILNRFLVEAEQLHKQEAEKQKEYEITFPEVTSRASQSITPPPIQEKEKPKPKEILKMQTLKNRPVLKPISMIKPTIKRRKPRLQLLRERLLAARARKENALALKALAEANRIKMETMLAVHRAGFIRAVDANGQMTLKKVSPAPEVIADSDYDMSMDEGNFREVQDVLEED
uniref:C2H2-type domain-containing protein n=1 Tax=Bursaphelenchus xylophilus TaxID=6326 RepID=A0A1I7RWN1_BURXY